MPSPHTKKLFRTFEVGAHPFNALQRPGAGRLVGTAGIRRACAGEAAHPRPPMALLCCEASQDTAIHDARAGAVNTAPWALGSASFARLEATLRKCGRVALLMAALPGATLLLLSELCAPDSLTPAFTDRCTGVALNAVRPPPGSDRTVCPPRRPPKTEPPPLWQPGALAASTGRARAPPPTKRDFASHRSTLPLVDSHPDYSMYTHTDLRPHFPGRGDN
jgi:hypothetical protein